MKILSKFFLALLMTVTASCSFFQNPDNNMTRDALFTIGTLKYVEERTNPVKAANNIVEVSNSLIQILDNKAEVSLVDLEVFIITKVDFSDKDASEIAAYNLFISALVDYVERKINITSDDGIFLSSNNKIIVVDIIHVVRSAALTQI